MQKKWLACAVSFLLLFFAITGTIMAEPAASPVVSEETWQYLEEHSPGTWGIIARSLGGRTADSSVVDSVHLVLHDGLSEGFSSITQFESAILSLIKLEKNPGIYERQNLITLLAEDNYLYHEGLNGASMALLVYQSAAYYEIEIDPSLRNSSATVIDYLVSSQQREGGFSVSAGRKPDIKVTALAVTALAAYRETLYVNSAVEKALNWLSTQQNPDGSYSGSDGQSDCETTAVVLTAIRTCGVTVDDPRFIKADGTLLTALARFQSPGGAYGPSYETSPTVEATEQAVIALYTNEYGLSPFLHPAVYPGYLPPVVSEEQPSAQSSMWLFFGKFLLMLGIIYLLLMCTIWIGKYGELKKLPGSLAAERKRQLKAEAEAPLDINIPMKAQLPDFDQMEEKETGLPTDDHPD